VTPMFYDQSQYDIRCEWGERGVRAIAPGSDVVIIVDVFSFSTTVDIALSRGAVVFPFQWLGSVEPEKFAREKNAVLLGKFPGAKYPFRPKAMFDIAQNARLVLPSPNGAAISLMVDEIPMLTGCFRNRRAIAEYAQKMGKKIAVIPCGERWEDNSLRPGLEDWLAAGAIISMMPGTKSPEASAAAATFEAMRGDLENVLKNTSSGQELLQKGRHDDPEIVAQIDCSDCVPRLIDGAYMDVAKREVMS
jgi:2-phosphosulfolactate phosphatase